MRLTRRARDRAVSKALADGERMITTLLSEQDDLALQVDILTVQLHDRECEIKRLRRLVPFP